jgi:hypothetical protein
VYYTTGKACCQILYQFVAKQLLQVAENEAAVIEVTGTGYGARVLDVRRLATAIGRTAIIPCKMKESHPE